MLPRNLDKNKMAERRKGGGGCERECTGERQKNGIGISMRKERKKKEDVENEKER